MNCANCPEEVVLDSVSQQYLHYDFKEKKCRNVCLKCGCVYPQPK